MGYVNKKSSVGSKPPAEPVSTLPRSAKETSNPCSSNRGARKPRRRAQRWGPGRQDHEWPAKSERQAWQGKNCSKPYRFTPNAAPAQSLHSTLGRCAESARTTCPWRCGTVLAVVFGRPGRFPVLPFSCARAAAKARKAPEAGWPLQRPRTPTKRPAQNRQTKWE